MKLLPLAALLTAFISTTALAEVRRLGPGLHAAAEPSPQAARPSASRTSRYPVQIDRAALAAGAQAGRFELPSTGATPLVARDVRQRKRADGLIVWTGKVDTRFGTQSVLLTLGEGVAFGLIPQFDGPPLRLETRRGRMQLVEGPQSLPDFAIDEPDFVRPPAPDAAGRELRRRQDSAKALGDPTIDVVVVYTPNLVTVWGSNAAVLARIAHLEEITNQAYVDSATAQNIRVVGTHLIDYSVNNDNDDALYAITGAAAGSSESLPVRQEVLRLRTMYGADLVKMLRNFDRSSQNSCGVGWLGGQEGAPFTVAHGFSVTSDHGFANDNCGEWTFAHELGHNMGAHHDVETASGEDGAYPYSHGLRQTLSPTSGFATIMAYTTGPQVRIGRFSNPRQVACLGQPCGDVATADNARGLSESAAIVAAFTPANATSGPPALSVGDAQISEGNSGQKALAFTFTLSAPAASNVTINISTMSGSATGAGAFGSNEDFVPQTNSTLVIPAGQTSGVHNVMLRGDTAVERDEVFALNIVSAANARIVDGQGVGTILNDEATPTLSIADISFDEGNTGTTQGAFTVSLTAASTEAVTFDFHTHDYSAGPTAATPGSDYDLAEFTGLTIQPGQTTLPVSVPVYGDTGVEQEERFYVMINNVVGANVGDVFAVGRIRNDDGIGANASVAIRDAIEIEGNSGTRQARFTVELAAAVGSAITIPYSTAAGSATSGTDFTAATGNLQIAAGQVSGFIDVAILGDTVDEVDETFTVTLAAGAGYTLTDAQGLGTIVDDDGVLPTLATRPDRQIGNAGGMLQTNPAQNDLFDALRLQGGSLSVVSTQFGSTTSVVAAGNGSPHDDELRVTPPAAFVGEEVVTYRLCEGAPQPRCVDGRSVIDFQVAVVGSGMSAAGYADSSIPSRSPTSTSYAGAYSAAPLVAPFVELPTIAADPTPETPWDGARPGTAVFVRTLPSTPGVPVDWRMLIDVVASGNATPAELGHVDLYVGPDTDGGGDADQAELACASAADVSSDRCVLPLQHPGTGAVRYWVLVHNRGSRTHVAKLDVFEVPLIATDGSVVVTGAGTPNTGSYTGVRVSWSDPTLLPGDSRATFIGARGFPSQALDYSEFRIDNADATPPARVLGSGEERTFALPVGGAHERLFVDVPAGATRLEVRFASSQDIDLYLARGSEAQTPQIAAAPARSAASASAVGPGGTGTLVVQGAQLQAGRWYITPVNVGNVAATFELEPTITATAPVVRPGSYFDPNRSGHGMFLYPAGNEWAGLWYTYLQDNSPTWYYMQAARPGANGIWDAGLYRSMWNGTSNTLTKVGRVIVTPTAADAFRFTFDLDGETGSEPVVALGRGCPTLSSAPLDVSSHWFNPATAGTGHSVQMFPNYEFYASFVYDRFGVPRFLTAERNLFGGASAVLALDQLSGFCPMCNRVAAPGRTTIGTLTRTFSGGTFSALNLQGSYVFPVEGQWTRSESVQALGGPGTTQGCLP